MELRNALGSKLGMQLPATLVFDYPTVAALAGHLAGVAADSVAAGPTATGGIAASGDQGALCGDQLCLSPGAAMLAQLPTQQRLVSVAAISALLPCGGTTILIPNDASSGVLPRSIVGLYFWQIAAREARHPNCCTIVFIAVVPLERWDVDTFDAKASPATTLEARFGAFVAGAQLFDAAAFGMGRQEAVYMDPQQRLLLEHAAEALAGMPSGVATQRTGVMVGIGPNEHLQVAKGLLPLGPHTATGVAISVAAGR